AGGQLLDRAAAELVDSQAGEEIAGAVQPRHLHRHHAAAPGRHRPRVGGVRDVSRGRHLVDEDELDPLDVPDDRASHSPTGFHVSLMMAAVRVPAFERFYVQHRDEVLGYLRRLLGQRAEDAWQETFLRALRAYDRLEHGRHLRAWVFTIATRVAIDELRSTRNGEVSLDGATVEPEAPELEAPAYRELEPLTSELPPTERAAGVLRYRYDLTYSAFRGA